MGLRTGAARGPRRRLGRSFRQHQPLHMKALENIPNLDVVEVGNACAALKSGAHFTCVVLEPAERTDAPGVNHNAFAQHADFGVTLEHTIQNVAARDHADALDAERVPHFGPAQMSFLEDRIEQAGHGLFDLVGDFVDERVRADRTLNATMIAPEADASNTSFSVTAPMLAWIILSFTRSSESFGNISLN